MNARLLQLTRMDQFPSMDASKCTTLMFPFDPVLCVIPTFQLSQLPCEELQSLGEFIKPQTLADEEIMMSFDVMCLFTSVPTYLVIQVACCELENDATLPECTNLSIDDIVDLLTLSLEATFLSFRGKAYQQVHDTALGSPVSVVVANLVMKDVGRGH